ncbi:oxidoreductase [Frondihabitans sp. PAMC 28766]|nr:oxidoreductase [Frondihabitans sp. PAMC 28766]
MVGSGWRSSVFLRLAYALPERFRVTGVVTRRAEPGAEVEASWGVPTYRSFDDLLAVERPDFVVVSVPWAVTPELTRELVARGIPVLSETPPAPDLDGMRSLWADVGASRLVQIAEQYELLPSNAARLTLARDGVIGTPTGAHVSSTHLYHAVALMRAALGVGLEPATVVSHAFTAPLVDPITPAGWTQDSTPKDARSILSTIDFGAGRTGVYDFTDNQWWNPLRPDHLRIRGSAGEIDDDDVVRLADPVTPVISRLERAMSGQGMNYEGLDLTHVSFDGRVVFRNEFEGARLMDDDIAVATLLARMGAWIREDGAPPYPLAQGLHDHQIGLAIDEATASGLPVTTTREPWALADRTDS